MERYPCLARIASVKVIDVKKCVSINSDLTSIRPGAKIDCNRSRAYGVGQLGLSVFSAVSSPPSGTTPRIEVPASSTLIGSSASDCHGPFANSRASSGRRKAAPGGTIVAANRRSSLALGTVTTGRDRGGNGEIRMTKTSTPLSPQRSIRPARSGSDRMRSGVWIIETASPPPCGRGVRISFHPSGVAGVFFAGGEVASSKQRRRKALSGIVRQRSRPPSGPEPAASAGPVPAIAAMSRAVEIEKSRCQKTIIGMIQ